LISDFKKRPWNPFLTKMSKRNAIREEEVGANVFILSFSFEDQTKAVKKLLDFLLRVK